MMMPSLVLRFCWHGALAALVSLSTAWTSRSLCITMPSRPTICGCRTTWIRQSQHLWNTGTCLSNHSAIDNSMIHGCIDYYPYEADRCLVHERDRVDMSLRQPQSMYNFTSTGFKSTLWNPIQAFWKNNRGNEKPENWPPGNSYTNHWSSPTYLLNIVDHSLEGGGFDIKEAIYDAVKSTIQEWTGQELRKFSLYGVRIYTERVVPSTLMLIDYRSCHLQSSMSINISTNRGHWKPLGMTARLTMVS